MSTRRTGSAALRDVGYVEVVKRGRSLKALMIAIALVFAGGLMAWLSMFDVVGMSIGKLTASAGLDAGPSDVKTILDGTLGGFTGMISQTLRLGGIAMLLLAPLMFFYYLVSGELIVGANLGGEQVAVSVKKSQGRTAQAFVSAFFKCKTAAA